MLSRYKSGQNHLTEFIGVEPSKKRKRRTSFTPQALELLNAHFERNTHPSGKIFLICIFLINLVNKVNRDRYRKKGQSCSGHTVSVDRFPNI